MVGGEPWLMFLSSGFFIENVLCRVLFTRRGHDRSLRSGFGLSRISSIAARVAARSLRGGKSRLVRDLAADDAEGAHERHPVGIEFGLVCRFSESFSSWL
jgi:hypothetical protein